MTTWWSLSLLSPPPGLLSRAHYFPNLFPFNHFSAPLHISFWARPGENWTPGGFVSWQLAHRGVCVCGGKWAPRKFFGMYLPQAQGRAHGHSSPARTGWGSGQTLGRKHVIGWKLKIQECWHDHPQGCPFVGERTPEKIQQSETKQS